MGTRFFSKEFKVGDYVRIARTTGTFEQRYIPNWSRQVYIITKVQQTRPITYLFKEEDNTQIEGAFYTQELQLTEKPEYYDVQKVLKQRKVKGKLQYFVKWLGCPDSYNSRTDAENVRLNK
jgi:phosphoenolpyruvate synthase/pyruvate phosphate dikinase